MTPSPSSHRANPKVTVQAILRRFGSARPLAVTESADGLSVDLADGRLGGTWVTVTVREAGGADHNTSFVLSARVEGADELSSTLDDEALGGGTFAWTGQLMPGIRALRIAPISALDCPSITEIEIRPRSRLALVLRGLARHPRLTLDAVWWRCLSKKVRSRAMLARAVMPQPDTDYRRWLKHRKGRGRPNRRLVRRQISTWAAPPLISILMPVHDPKPAVLDAAIRSVRAQLYPDWELCITDDASRDPEIVRLLDRWAGRDKRIRLVRRAENGHIAHATNDALALANGSWVAFLDHDDLLPTEALFEVARAIADDPRLVLIYSDEDKIDADGQRCEPHFKPDFDRELLFGQNYFNHLTVVRTDALREVGGLRPGFEGSQDHDMLLRLAAGLDPARIRHIPTVLYHWRAAGGSGTFSDRAMERTEEARLRALAEVATSFGGRAERGPLGFNRLVRPLPDTPPRVSVIIPTRDRADLLKVTLDGLRERTEYPDIEVILVDNDSREEETRALFAAFADEPRHRVVPAPGPFNFSDLSNRGAAAASGTVLLFLNNDVEVIEPGWLAELASIALDPAIGIVGAKLLYPDLTVQHGGIVLGIGSGRVAGHSHLGLPDDDPGYFAGMTLSHEVSAVTGACLCMRAEVFREVGGFDAEHLKVAFNDVDLCLRVRRAGYRIVWTPFSRLIHHESKSRGPEDTPEKKQRFARETAVMLERWGAELRADPYYNINLSRISAHYQF